MPFRPSVARIVLGALAAPSAAAQTPDPAPAQTPPSTTPSLPALPAAPAPSLSGSRDFTFAAADRPLPITAVPGHIQVFILEDLERSGARTVGDFLARELPAQFQQTGGAGLPVYAYQGGARPQDTVVLLDGMRLSDPSQPAPDLNAIPLTGIVRLEVLTGTDSTRVGPGAEGGVLAIYTAGAMDRGATGELAGQGGSSGQGQGRALPSFGWGSGWFHVGSQTRREDQSTDTPNGYRAVTSFATFGQQMGPLLLSFSYRNHYQGVPDPYVVATDIQRIYDPTREAGYRDQSGGLGLRLDLGGGFALALSGGSQSINRLDPVPQSFAYQRSTGRTDQGDLALIFCVPHFGLRLHVGGFRQRGEQGYEGSESTNSGQIRHGGAGLELSFEPLSVLRFTAEGGVQSDRSILNPFFGQPSDNTNHAATFKSAMNLGLPLGFRFYAGGGQGYNAPTLPQLLFNTGLSDLAPLQGEHNGFGFAGFGWGKGNWSSRLESSRSTYRDVITFNGIAYRNTGHLRVQSTEATVGYSRGGFGGEGFVRAQEAKDLKSPDDPYGTPTAINRPFHSHGLKVFGGGGPLRVDLRYRQVGANYQIVSGPPRRDGSAPRIESVVTYQVMDAIATLTLGKHWTLIARGENLLQPRTTVDQWLSRQEDDQKDAYRSFGFPAPGPKTSLEVVFRY